MELTPVLIDLQTRNMRGVNEFGQGYPLYIALYLFVRQTIKNNQHFSPLLYVVDNKFCQK